MEAYHVRDFCAAIFRQEDIRALQVLRDSTRIRDTCTTLLALLKNSFCKDLSNGSLEETRYCCKKVDTYIRMNPTAITAQALTKCATDTAFHQERTCTHSL